MIKHIYKLIWNQKRQNLGLLVEVFVSFLVIFSVFAFLVYNFRQYSEPIGFHYDRVLVVQLEPNRDYEIISTVGYQEYVRQNLELIDRQLKDYPEFEAYSFAHDTPYTGGQTTTAVKNGTDNLRVNMNNADEQFAEVLNMRFLEGRWFKETEAADPVQPVILNKSLSEQLFPGGDAVGQQVLTPYDAVFKVVGVVEDYKPAGEFSSSVPLFFAPVKAEGFSPLTLSIKLKPGIDASIKARIYEDIKLATKTWSMEINYMDELRSKVLQKTWIPVILFLTISGFLIFNVALGLFGVVWQNINKRKQEIGVRRAMGATKSSIRRQIVGETVVLASLSVVLGIFFAVQFPLLDVFQMDPVIYFVAIALAVLFIFLVVVACSVYPSMLAAQLHPAVALRED